MCLMVLQGQTCIYLINNNKITFLIYLLYTPPPPHSTPLHCTTKKPTPPPHGINTYVRTPQLLTTLNIIKVNYTVGTKTVFAVHYIIFADFLRHISAESKTANCFHGQT